MKNFLFISLLCVFLCFLIGCASSYKTIDPPTLSYSVHTVNDGIGLSYKYDVLREKGNYKYAKKEARNGIKIVAVRLTNYVDTIINVSNDLEFYLGDNQLLLLEPSVTKSSIKQSVPSYLPYMLLSLITLTVTNQNGTKIYPIGLAIGPGITLGNMLTAGSANKKFLKELTEYTILNKDIPPGGTIYGLIGIRDVGFNPITVKRKINRE